MISNRKSDKMKFFNPNDDYEPLRNKRFNSNDNKLQLKKKALKSLKKLPISFKIKNRYYSPSPLMNHRKNLLNNYISANKNSSLNISFQLLN